MRYLLCLFLASCSADRCSDAALAEREARLAAELIAACVGYDNVDQCPAAGEILARYDVKEWNECY